MRFAGAVSRGWRLRRRLMLLAAFAGSLPAAVRAQDPAADPVAPIFAAYRAGDCKAALDHAARLSLAENDSSLTGVLQVRGLCLKRLGRVAEAEQAMRAAIERLERQGQGESIEFAVALDNLGNLYMESRRLKDAEALRLRALDIFKAKLPAGHPHIVTALQNLAVLYQFANRNADASRFYEEALAGAEKSYGAQSIQVGIIADNFAGFARASGDMEKARGLYLRAIAIFEKQSGAEHPDTVLALQNYAIFLGEAGEHKAAEDILRRAVAINARLYGASHVTVAAALNTLTLHEIEQKRWPEAQTEARRAAAIATEIMRQGADLVPSEGGQRLSPFRRLVQALYAEGGAAADPAVMDEAFRAGQSALDSAAAGALHELAQRFSTGDAALATLLREAQDLGKESAAADQALVAAVARKPAERSADDEARLRQRLSEIARRRAAIDGEVATRFPRFRALAAPEPLSIAAVQALLRPDEALVLFVDLQATGAIAETGFAWAVTRSAARFVKLATGTGMLAARVMRLRCGLDMEAAGGETCAKITKDREPSPTGAGSLPAFDTATARALYRDLFGSIEDIIEGRQLLVVPSGALANLPLQVLVTGDDDAQGRTAWLVRKHAISVLPAVASLAALRGIPERAHPARPYVAFANPLLDGEGAEGARLGKLARERTQCETQPRGLSSLRLAARSPARPVRLRLADGAFIRAQTPLPETADEVCAVAHDLGAGAGDVLLGPKASEGALKAMSASGVLADYRIVHLATHGALSGQIAGSAEPGLILTPPASPTADDDGYLAASEIAQLQLNADLVVLSACNTAGAGADGGEALSGLARAFFYAGARSVLASHWAVDSAATVALVTRAAAEMRSARAGGRAEAFRRAMLARIDSAETGAAHPARWAPFVLVGEGASDAQQTDGEAGATAAAVPPAVKVPAVKKAAGGATSKMRRKNAPEADWKDGVFAPSRP